MAVKIGPVSAKFTGKVTLADIAPPDSYKLAFEGQGGVAGFGKGSSQASRCTPDAATGCELDYTVQAQVGGKIAQLGQRLIDGAAKSMADDFFKRFDAEMQRRYGPPPEAAADGSRSRAGRKAASGRPASCRSSASARGSVQAPTGRRARCSGRDWRQTHGKPRRHGAAHAARLAAGRPARAAGHRGAHLGLVAAAGRLDHGAGAKTARWSARSRAAASRTT